MRREVLDENGRYAQVMFDEHVAEVRAFVVEEFQELAAKFEYENNWPRELAEQVATYWSAYGKLPPDEIIQAALTGGAVPD